MKIKQRALDVARALAGVDTMPYKHGIALTSAQWKWLSEIMPSDWESIGDCTYGYQRVQNKDLGIGVTYSYITKQYNLEVDL